MNNEIAESKSHLLEVSEDMKHYYGDEVNKAGRAHKVVTIERLKQENEQLLKVIQTQKKEIEHLIRERSLSTATKSVV